MEKTIYSRLKHFLDSHNILYKYQFGFRENHSTFHALIDSVEYIYKSLDEKKFVFGIYIELKKAFNTVSRDILLSKLQQYGVRGNALKWFESYLSNRKKDATTNGIISDLRKLGHMEFHKDQC